MRTRTINALLAMGMPANIKGFTYIADAMELFEDSEIKDGKVTYLYYLIGEKRNVTASSVEGAIIRAFGIVMENGNVEEIKKYLTMQRTTNGNLLHVLYLRLVQEGNENED